MAGVNFKSIQQIIKKQAIVALGNSSVRFLVPQASDATSGSPQRGKVIPPSELPTSAVEVKNEVKGNARIIELLVPGDLTPKPKQGWQCISADGLTYQVVSVGKTSPNGVDIVYKVKIQR